MPSAAAWWRTLRCGIDVAPRTEEFSDVEIKAVLNNCRLALIAVDFTVDGARRVADPRAAVQPFFSSAIDALVIGRFLLLKDYWLMRSGA